ncbi:hypothetical protein NP233_g12151 [Leucocoprinus birnbaumii]|uniref:Uncharacterized protein n=1 Tax=Leucocoprinus birnbaumii TaxID=56174 RepID=A0AAD5VKP2_9AGAR|nr:hypothetical protein NP233_g12151 [Leucocoprinus birnbaumii]
MRHVHFIDSTTSSSLFLNQTLLDPFTFILAKDSAAVSWTKHHWKALVTTRPLPSYISLVQRLTSPNLSRSLSITCDI